MYSSFNGEILYFCVTISLRYETSICNYAANFGIYFDFCKLFG